MYHQTGKLDDDEARALDIINSKSIEPISIRLIMDLEEEGLILHEKDENGYCGELTTKGRSALKVYQTR